MRVGEQTRGLPKARPGGPVDCLLIWAEGQLDEKRGTHFGSLWDLRITIFKDDSSKLKNAHDIRILRWAGSSRDWKVGRGRWDSEKG